jgi:hypothetical protein
MSDGKGGTDSEEGGPHHREVVGSATMPRAKGLLGCTPNHLSLSTTSTLSAGSTGKLLLAFCIYELNTIYLRVCSQAYSILCHSRSQYCPTPTSSPGAK